MSKFPQKIHIVGSVGSGKTTLAREMTVQLTVPHYELDNMMWKRSPDGDVRRSEKLRRQILQDITSRESWIIEGVHTADWIEESLRQADLIIWLTPAPRVHNIRIAKRYLRQITGLEKANYTPSFRMFLKMFKWNRYFEKSNKPYIYDAFSKYGDKVMLVENKADVEAFIRNLNHTKAS
ncbi:DNA topology modulation protein FlaR [Terribacillus sp. DMT04]|uniref:DNA topology modulation protein FlaR n=1 Tax=Terribacillus sp. DMT04 TaxID=2850441 RepID=UPI001C2BEF22|nr:DNA topology modulation protein FlaR [Terribacillus sp. DMT04]QXE02187.1 DNA topology modulation protein FlaR [Terribacillus sp. DMT04]